MYMNNILQYQFDLLMIILRGRDTLSTINQFMEKIQIKKKNSKFSFDENIADKWWSGDGIDRIIAQTFYSSNARDEQCELLA